MKKSVELPNLTTIREARTAPIGGKLFAFNSVLRSSACIVSQTTKAQALSDSVHIVAELRFDDMCGNGCESFAITAHGSWLQDGKRMGEFAGCCHDEIRESFPELAPFIKWHLTSTDGPMHYLANTLYHARQGAFDHARSCAVWPEATDDELRIELSAKAERNLQIRLQERLPQLLADFKRDMESIGFIYPTASAPKGWTMIEGSDNAAQV